MLAYRGWWVVPDTRGRPTLRSLAIYERWRSAYASADTRPEPDNENGIYGVLPGGRLPMFASIVPVRAVGAIDLYGKVVLHEDDVARGEHARILALRLLPNGCGRSHDHVSRLPDGSMFVYACPCWWQADRLRLLQQRERRLEDLEAELLDRYGVPRLPDGVALELTT